jgi:hypothetical protein
VIRELIKNTVDRLYYEEGDGFMAVQKVSLTYNDYIKGIQTLSPEEQLTLVEFILTNLKMVMLEKKRATGSKLAKLKPRKLVFGDPDELVNIKVWEWNEQHNL